MSNTRFDLKASELPRKHANSDSQWSINPGDTLKITRERTVGTIRQYKVSDWVSSNSVSAKVKLEYLASRKKLLKRLRLRRIVSEMVVGES